MKKRFNKFAIVIWVTAALVGALNLTALGDILRMSSRATGDPYFATNVLRAIAAAITPAAILAALGVVIEILDQIRWNATPRPE